MPVASPIWVVTLGLRLGYILFFRFYGLGFSIRGLKSLVLYLMLVFLYFGIRSSVLWVRITNMVDVRVRFRFRFFS